MSPTSKNGHHHKVANITMSPTSLSPCPCRTRGAQKIVFESQAGTPSGSTLLYIISKVFSSPEPYCQKLLT